jgi:CRP/FNR family transcriptional regulator/CRP/FNR family cyclic AMP-dependent transcriptional regulator
VSLLAGLSDEELSALADSLGKRTFGKGVIIFHRDSPGHTLYIIETGRVRIFLLSETGQEISLNIYGPGDSFGEMALLDGLPRSAGAITMEKTVVLTLHRDQFLRHIEAQPKMAMRIMEVLSRRLRYTTDYAGNLAFLDVYGRVAAKLLELADRYGVENEEGVVIDLRLTQAELASWVAATREFVNKVLGVYRDQGLIRIDGQRIAIVNRRGLTNRVSY